MNSVWLTSPFVKFNTDNLIYNETLSSEKSFRNKFSSMNRFEKKVQNYERRKNFNVTSDYFPGTNLTDTKENEVNFTMKSNSISHLREDISVSTSLLKIPSKTNLKKTESESTSSEININSHRDTLSQCSSNGTHEISFSNGSNFDEVSIFDDKSVSFGSKGTLEKNRSNRLEERNRSFVNRMSTGDRTVGDALFSCPFELVEIYPGNKENIRDLDETSSDFNRETTLSMGSLPKEDKKSSRSVVFDEHVSPLTRTRLKQVNEEICTDDSENAECRQNNKNREKNIYESILPAQKVKEDFQIKNVSLNDVNLSETCKLNVERNINFVTSNDTNISRCDGKEADLSKESSRKKFVGKPVESKDSLMHNTPKTAYPIAIENNSNSVGIKKDLNVKLISTLPEADMYNTDMFDEYSVKSDASRNTKYTYNSLKNTESSDADSLIMDDPMIVMRKRKSNSEMRSINENMNLKKIIEMRKKGQKSLNKNKLCDEEIGMVRVDTSKTEKNQNSGQKTVEYVIDDSRDGISEQNVTVDDNRKNRNICDLLMQIHKQLFINFQKMESIWINSQGIGPINSVRSTAALCLLTRIISRCKSYIHDSDDNCKAETMITKRLTNLIVQLENAVNQNKFLLEKQEQQINNTQSKYRHERNSYEKRRIINEVVSFWDRGLDKVCDVMQIISNMVQTIIAENKEKGDIRNPRQKSEVVNVKGSKTNFSKKESNIETETFKNSTLKQLKFKPRVNSIYTQKYREKENLKDFIQRMSILRKFNDNVRCSEKRKLLKKPMESTNSERTKQLTSRQKYRIISNSQPVWRPGGVAKVQSLSNVTVVPQKSRPMFTQANERLNQRIENLKETRRGRAGESKKKVSCETYSIKSINPETISKLKPKLGTLKVPLKRYKDSSRSESPSSKNSEKAPSLEKVNRQKPSKESKVLDILEKIIKSTPTDDKTERNTNKSVNGYQYRAETDSTSIKKQIKIPEEEPTRDIDSNQMIKSQSRDKMFYKQQQQQQYLTEKIPNPPTAVITATSSVLSSTTDDNENVHSKSSSHFETSRPKDNSNFTSVTNTSCTADFTSSSDYISRFESSKCSPTSPKQQKIKGRSYSKLRSPNFTENKSKGIVRREILTNPLATNVETPISATPRIMSLNMLKELLYAQGVDINLINMAEQYMKNKQKYGNCLKKKSASLADVMFDTKLGKCSEILLQNSNCQRKSLKKIVEHYEDLNDSTDLEDTPRKIDENYETSLKYSIPRIKDTLTSFRDESRKDASFQTKLHETDSKAVQVIFKEDAPLMIKQETMETQTEMISMKHATTNCCIKIENATKFTNKGNNISSMTEPISVTDSFTQVVQISCISKSIATEQSDLPKKIENNIQENSTDFIIDTPNDVYSESIELENDQHLPTKHCKQLLNPMGECSDVSLRNREQYHDYKLHFDESHLKQSSECLNSSDSKAKMDAKLNNSEKVISSETITALQTAASIRIENLFKAFYIYQKHKESELNKQKDGEKCKKLDKKNSNEREEILKASSECDNIGVTIKDSCHIGKDIVNIFSRVEIASSSDESEYEISRSVSTPIVDILYNEQNMKDIPKKSSTTSVLKDVKSLMELLVQKIDDRKTEQIYGVGRVSSKTSAQIHIHISKTENEEIENSFSILSRQNLLPFIYGIVCFVVFWCLHFTIVCDVVT